MKKRHRVFVAAYLRDLDAKNAAIEAGYSARNAHSNAYRLLRLPEIAAAVEEGLAERSERARVTADRVFEEYAVLCSTCHRPKVGGARIAPTSCSYRAEYARGGNPENEI